MIVQNELVKSILVVLVFWYAFLFLVAGFHGIAPWNIVYAFSTSVFIAACGLAGGFALAIFFKAGDRLFRAEEIYRGGRLWGAQMSMGSPPVLPQLHRGKGAEAYLATTPWWPSIKQRSPEYAAAIHAVAEAMLAMPRFPASAYPGGHGGRSLIEHSLAVATEMLRQASTWVYAGQMDKRGNVRVPLTGEPHRFHRDDAPLLIVAGFAHDIGKMIAWEPLDDQAPSRATGELLRVREVRPTHDQEGARLLRQIPEIMALPFADRTALLMAVGYYHHPFGLPMSIWMTDRIRSLTELLALSDIETGKAEGHTLIDAAENDDEIEGGLTSDIPAPESAESAEQEDDLDAIAALAKSLLGSGKAKPSFGAKVTPPPQAAPPTPAFETPHDNLPLELRQFMVAIRRPGAINGRQRNQRIAWKYGDHVYVMEKIMRTLILNQGGIDPVWGATAMAEANGNAAPFTVSLAEQLQARGALITEHGGQQFSPARALFRMKMSASSIPVLIVRASAIPGAGGIPDAERPVEILGPLWGSQSAKNKATRPAEAAATPAGQPVVATPGTAASELPIEVDYEDLRPSPPVPAPAPELAATPPKPTAKRSLIDGLEDDDLPFDLSPVAATEDATPTATTGNTSNDAAEILREIIVGDEFKQRFQYEIREKGGVLHAVIPVASPAGTAITRAIDNLRENGADVSAVKVARTADTGEAAYIFPL